MYIIGNKNVCSKLYFKWRYDLINHIRYLIVARIWYKLIVRTTSQLNHIMKKFLQYPQKDRVTIGPFYSNIRVITVHDTTPEWNILFSWKWLGEEIQWIVIVIYFVRNQYTCWNTLTEPMETNELVIII